jgi:hypothetical protein
MGRYWSNGYLRLIMERISSIFSPTIVAASIQKAFEYPIVGEAIYTGVGPNTWTCPAGVYSVSVVCIAGGGGGLGGATNSATGGGGGALAYKNNVTVVPGLTYNLQVGQGGYTAPTGTRVLATNSWFGNTSTVFAERGQFGRTATGPSTVQGISQSGLGGRIFIGDGGGPGGNAGAPQGVTTFNGGLGAGGAGGYGYTSSEIANWYSTYFDGVSDVLRTSTNDSLSLGRSDFTLEFWYNLRGFTVNSAAGPTLVTSANFFAHSGKWRISLGQNYTGYLGVVIPDSANSLEPLLIGTTWYASNTWTHVALQRSANTFTLFKNGIAEDTKTYTGSFSTSSDFISIGNIGTGNANSFVGHISNLRLVKGRALYSSNFIPSEEPLVAITNTVLLTCQDSTFKDNSGNNITITIPTTTVGNNVRTEATYPFDLTEINRGGDGGVANSTSGGNGTAGVGGAGGGGAGASTVGGAAGGGVGLYGRGISGVAGLTGLNMNDPLRAGQPGSNGLPLVANTIGTTIFNIGGRYGGGGGGGQLYYSAGANGAVRIVWPSDFRTFPTSNLETHTVTQNIQYANLQMGYAVSLQPVSISGNVGPVTYSITPSIPANTNITFNANTGILSGNATSGYPETAFTIRTVDSVGQSSANTLIMSIAPPSGQEVFVGENGGNSFNTVQTTWTVPANVYSISAMAVGCGGSTVIEANGYSSFSGGSGGATAFINNFRVEPGQQLSIYIDKPRHGYNVSSNGTSVSYANSVILRANSGANPTSFYTSSVPGGSFRIGQYGYSGGVGGSSSTGNYKAGGGGAAGYTGNGGTGGNTLAGAPGGGTSGGGGGGAPSADSTTTGKGGGGGGVGLQGKGASGSGSSYIPAGNPGMQGGTGSNRGELVELYGTNTGSDYGGGAGGGDYRLLNSGGYGGIGAVRIMWPGTLRRYDANTRTEDTRPIGQAEFTSFGTYTWVCPEGVYSVSAVCVGAGGTGASSQFSYPAYAGGGAGLGYKNNIPVVPGQSYTIQVGRRGEWVANTASLPSTNSFFISATTVAGNAGGFGGAGGSWGGTFVGDGGGNGGSGGVTIQNYASGGGGAGGYSGTGGSGGYSNTNAATNGSGGGGGGGGGTANGTRPVGGQGGGVGLLGQGANGVAGSGWTITGSTYYANNATAGSGGSGTSYGGGGGTYARYGGDGAVRLIWPGDQRRFPSTRTGNE